MPKTAEAPTGANNAGTPAQAKGAVAQATNPAQARRDRAKAQLSGAPKREDPRARYTLADGEQWHDLPNGGSVGITITDSGFESVVEVSSQARVRRGVSVGALTVLLEAGRI